MSTPRPEPLRAAIYTRISKDREGAGLGVDRQEAECRLHADRLGWEVVEVYADNDISAYSGKPRPGYRAMLDAIRSGQVQGVVAWHTDRIHRRATELEEFVTIAEAHALQVQTVRSGQVDLSTPSGRMVARMLGAAAQHEVEQTRSRIRAQKAQAAASGKYRGGPRPYGYERDGLTIREDEAQVVREATRDVLAGRSLSAVARELAGRGLVTASKGLPWEYDSLRDMLLRPRNAGLLSKGRPGREGFEIVGAAQWPALVDEDSWRALHALLTDPARRISHTTERRWLGSGIYTCGKDGCGALMRAAPHSRGPDKSRTPAWHYRCEGQAHLTVETSRTDRFVRAALAELVRDPRVLAGMTAPDPDLAAHRERRIALAHRLDGLEADYVAGRIDGSQFQRFTAQVQADLDDVDERIAASVRRSASSPVLRAADPGRALLDAPLDVQRAVLRSLLRVEIAPAEKKGAKWSKDRIKMTEAVES